MAMEGSDDVYVHKFTISLGGKTLFQDCKMSLAYGRRYGLVGVQHAQPQRAWVAGLLPALPAHQSHVNLA